MVQTGRAAAHLDERGQPERAAEAARLVALNHGIGTTVLIGQRTAEQGRAVLQYRLDARFGTR